MAAETAIHEGFHAQGVAGSKRAEVLARVASMQHRTGVDKILLSSPKDMYREVYSLPDYAALPNSLGTQNPQFPNVKF
ncbi:hypothetical protein GCM10007907_30330 [Chitinimonas prasina]|uniref:Uncharacterized protein n=1 Tax=Chitinimonas prasina TaxID=1434937 RepID=A0ABQ5YKN7_9NEIS|nr:hypothetical protein [Chitinimonas prasina]GLR14243.1 hypothetical protein GCM10007907_30330 [Chitinimonas prasina]